mmetsp:Transcript_26340/g.60206  ORF Transcript_26340/g.60206 Transcript_26340/m.60206 type:complete len:202 (-) Transcript_26340:476-1081(-)
MRGRGTGWLHGVREDAVSLVHRIVALAQVRILSPIATSSRVWEIVRLAMDAHTKDPDCFPDLVRRGVDGSGVVIAEGPSGEFHDRNVVGVRPVSVAIEWTIRVRVRGDGVVLVVHIINHVDLLEAADTVGGRHDVVVAYDCACTITAVEEGNEELGAVETRYGLLWGFLRDDGRGAPGDEDEGRREEAILERRQLHFEVLT